MLLGVFLFLSLSAASLAPLRRRHVHGPGLTRCSRRGLTPALPCPPGLACEARASQRPQETRYLAPRGPLSCLGPPPPPALDAELAVLINLFGAASQSIFALETPIQIRAVYYFDSSTWNTLTAYHATAKPTAIAPGFGLPFAERRTTAPQTDRNTALCYSFMRMCEEVGVDSCGALRGLLGALGLDPDYRKTSNFDFSDPRDVGLAAALATIEYSKTDGWNSRGDVDGAEYQFPFSDYTNSVPPNSPTNLTDITGWQPLLETQGKGYFTHQTHVGALLGGRRVSSFGLNTTDFYTQFSLRNPQVYPKQNEFTEQDLADYKDQADEVILTLATLTYRQKMLSVLFDNKIMGFGFVPIGQVRHSVLVLLLLRAHKILDQVLGPIWLVSA